MLSTLSKREKFIEELLKYLELKHDLSDSQIFVFGSFLTDEFELDKSDIDIGVYSETEVKMFDIKLDIELYLDKFNLKHDIVIMHLNKKLWINVPIMTYGKALTQYESEKLFNYLIEMIKEYGFNPIEKLKEI